MGSRKFYESTWFIFLMLLTISPVGIFLLWKYNRYSASTRKILSAAGGIYFIAMMIVANLPDKKPATEVAAATEPAATETPTTPEVSPSPTPTAAEATATPAPTQTEATVTPSPKPEETATTETPPSALKDYMPWLINKLAGTKSNIDNQGRIRSTEYESESVFIELMADDNFSMSTIRSDILEKSTKIFKQVFAERQDVPELYLSWNLPLQDSEGENETVTPVLVVSMTKETAAATAWDTFTYSELPTSADSYTEHEVLKN